MRGAQSPQIVTLLLNIKIGKPCHMATISTCSTLGPGTTEECSTLTAREVTVDSRAAHAHFLNDLQTVLRRMRRTHNTARWDTW